MRNWKVSVKLIVGFSIIALLTVCVGVAAIVGMLQLNERNTAMYNENLQPLPNVSTIVENAQRLRVAHRDYLIAVYSGNSAGITTAHNDIAASETALLNAADSFKTLTTDVEAINYLNQGLDVFNNQYKPILDECFSQANNGDSQGLLTALNSASGLVNNMTVLFGNCMTENVTAGADSSKANDDLASYVLWLVVGILLVSIAAAVVLTFYITNSISKPLIPLTAFMHRAGSTGDIALTSADKSSIDKFSMNKDETGRLISACIAFVDHITESCNALEKISDGDLTVSVNNLSPDKDTLGLSLNKMANSLNDMFGDLNSASEQVATGASHVADAAQSLASGATEQAASVEELSSSVSEIADRTKTNADMAYEAANLADVIKESAEKGTRQMDDMIAAVKDINVSSQSISRVIKAIDDIAFQTNILALNAAVEAARAGTHGKGFAVVAEEVRNLASRSAAAAKETATMIADSMGKSDLGVSIAEETAKSLADIVSGINESAKLVGQIAESSKEQSVNISQINTGIDQVAQVVQHNSATAEQSAAASQEMSGQASVMLQLASSFKLRKGGFSGSTSSHRAPSTPQDAYKARPTSSSGSSGSFADSQTSYPPANSSSGRSQPNDSVTADFDKY